jgi:hypothetical protein
MLSHRFPFIGFLTEDFVSNSWKFSLHFKTKGYDNSHIEWELEKK